MKDFLTEIKDDAEISLNPHFKVNITDARVVPSVDDPGITFEDLDNFEKNCKEIETCVLYADLRDSTKISARFSHQDLVKIYSTFVRSVIKSIQYKGGYVRNIIGDRVMAVFDSANCFEESVETAFLINTTVNKLLNKTYPTVGFKCGLGIDFGKMLVTKTGVIKMGRENAPNKSLVWLGQAANIASKLTDNANKTISNTRLVVKENLYYPYIKQWGGTEYSLEDFIKRLTVTNSKYLLHNEQHFYSFNFKNSVSSISTSPILVTQSVYDGFKKKQPSAKSILKNWWTVESIKIPGYTGKIMGANVFYTEVDSL